MEPKESSTNLKNLLESTIKKLSQQNQNRAENKNDNVASIEREDAANNSSGKKSGKDYPKRKPSITASNTSTINDNKNDYFSIYREFETCIKGIGGVLSSFDKAKTEIKAYLEVIKLSPKKSSKSRWYTDGGLTETTMCQEVTGLVSFKENDPHKEYHAKLISMLEAEKIEKSAEKLINELPLCRELLNKLLKIENIFSERLGMLKEDADIAQNAYTNNKDKKPGKKAQQAEEFKRLMDRKREEKLQEQQQAAEQKARRKTSVEKPKSEPKLNLKPPLAVHIPAPKRRSLVQENKPEKNMSVTEPYLKVDYLDHALRHYLVIKYILANYNAHLEEQNDNAIFSEITHYALLYNMARCFQALNIFKRNGGDPSKEIDKDSVEDLRNMIIHHGALEAKRDGVLKTANILANQLSDSLLKMRKPYLMDSALTVEQKDALLASKGLTNDPLYSDKHFKLVITEMPLYKELAKYHEAKVTNDMTFEDKTKKIDTVLAQISAIFEQIKKCYPMAPETKSLEKFYEFFLVHIQAIKSLLAICGELCNVGECHRKIQTANALKSVLKITEGDSLTNLSQFMLDCHQVRNNVGHCFTDEENCELSLDMFYSLCYRATDLIKRKSSLTDIAKRGFSVFEPTDKLDLNTIENQTAQEVLSTRYSSAALNSTPTV